MDFRWNDATEAEFAAFVAWLRTQSPSGKVAWMLTPSNWTQVSVEDAGDDLITAGLCERDGLKGKDGEWLIPPAYRIRADLAVRMAA